MNDEPDNETIKKVMQELGRRGGQATSKKKRDAVKKSLEKARESRWPKKAGGRPKKKETRKVS